MSNSSQVIILTDRKDAHVPYVQCHLTGDCVIIDPQELASGLPLSIAATSNGTVVVTYNGIELTNVTGIWQRKPQPVGQLPVPAELQVYSASAIERLYSMLLVAFPSATRVSDYYAGLRASNKLLQLEQARRLGFNTPDTIFTNSPAAAGAFLAEHPKSITKRLSRTVPRFNGRQALFMTTEVDDSFMPNLANLHLAPAIFQTAIEPKHDIRVTVVGDQTFAAYVKSGTVSHSVPIRDSRVGSSIGKISITEASDLPPKIAEQCVALVKALGLNFGAIDLIQDKSDVYWFIENNVGGQWAYIEEATALQIGRAIAELLEGGES